MVLKVRPAVGVVMIWLAAVAGVSVTASVAIDRAGRDITAGVASSLPPVTLGSALGTTTPDGTPSSDKATTERSATPEHSASRQPSATKEPTPTKEPSATPEASAPRDRTFSAAGGQVSVRCTGTAIRLRIAQPDNGWRVEVDSAGPEQVEVNFRRGDDEDRDGTRLTAVCATGSPDFRVENKG